MLFRFMYQKLYPKERIYYISVVYKGVIRNVIQCLPHKHFLSRYFSFAKENLRLLFKLTVPSIFDVRLKQNRSAVGLPYKID